jgi:hypothetical protein
MEIEPEEYMRAFEEWRRRWSECESYFRAEERRKGGANSGMEGDILYDFGKMLVMG